MNNLWISDHFGLLGEFEINSNVDLEIVNRPTDLIFKPGLTGLGNLKTHNILRNLTLFDEYYMQNQSFLFNLEILLKSMLKI